MKRNWPIVKTSKIEVGLLLNFWEVPSFTERGIKMTRTLTEPNYKDVHYLVH